jgi:hypothetical protein
LGDSIGLGIGEVSATFGLGATSSGTIFWGLGVFVGLGEPLVPLGLEGFGTWEEDCEAPGLRVFSALGILTLVGGSFVEGSNSISCGALEDE